ncbi:MAG: hypothetical protein IKX61_05530 [Prevotella sp.]|nr:hypothetical protein [Prevotella sp.]
MMLKKAMRTRRERLLKAIKGITNTQQGEAARGLPLSFIPSFSASPGLQVSAIAIFHQQKNNLHKVLTFPIYSVLLHFEWKNDLFSPKKKRPKRWN